MQRYLSLLLLVFFLSTGATLAPLAGQGAETAIKKPVSSAAATAKKPPAPASSRQIKANTQAKAALAPKGSPPARPATASKQAPSVAAPTATKGKAAITAGTTVKRQQPTGKRGGKQVAAPTQVTAKRAGSATPPPKQVVRQKKRSGRAAAATAATITAPGLLPCIADQISSKSVMVMDAATGEAIFAKAPDAPRQPASTIKIVTGMIAIKSLADNDYIRVSPKAAGMPSSRINLDPGHSYKADDLINAVLLASANDASVALAEGISGSEEQFANLMTMSARMWGASNTICRTASGLTAEGQQSTARDLANLFRYAMRHEAFSRRMHERTITTSYGKSMRNHNKALWKIDGADAGKTGYTTAARQTYVGQFSRDGHTIVVAIMGSESMWADLAKLVEYGFEKKRRDAFARTKVSRARIEGVSLR